ncbi:Gfo/Idh/MocA family oxidoreductase [Parabacteroides faecis]|uniref:Gfo/Idh/MocA family protein n=2 Tax=Parabacteroides faecis TaxID=1217282 RepID=UPI0021648244|nr:Gfo/Idh/MocA family oxidoreductase [Parabacteroides faecis]UVQ44707.1 Gfo/Idh/MocA family oxidoreductase [Parabacteroides faecis]
MKRRDFLRNTGLLASSSVILGHTELLEAKQSEVTKVMSAAPDDLDAKLDKPLTAVIIGAGGRGNVYAQYADQYPGSLQIVGVSDINEFRREKMGDRFSVKASYRFGDWSEVFKQPKFADIVFITTPDNLHYEPCMKALEMGYHVLLEKPAAQTEKECTDILKQSRKYNRIVAICHVLRYAPYFKALKKTVDSGKIGELVSIQHLEPIERIHFSHSYVRGNWNNSKNTTPAIISKSCHDLDILRWIVGKPCKEVTAFGSLSYFKSSKAPKGAAKRCLDCPIEAQCAFSAKKIYYDRRTWLHVFDLSGDKQQQGEQILSYLRTSDYGRCVFHSDNDQPDHFIMNMKFEDDVTVAFSMEALTSYGGRRTRIMGTKGDIVGDMQIFTITDFLTGKQEKWGTDINDGHGGGDLRLIRDLLWAVDKGDELLLTSTIDASIESHVMGFKAEEARLKETIERL